MSSLPSTPQNPDPGAVSGTLSHLRAVFLSVVCWHNYDVNIGILCLTRLGKIGYNAVMLRDLISFVLRIGLVAAVWAFVWRVVQPRTQLMRIFRAALLLLGLLAVLAVVRITGQ
jgi:hypothetical protein